jgi:hypothetical protein
VATVLALVLDTVVVAAPDHGDLPPLPAERHVWRTFHPDLDGYAASGLPACTMGRGIAQDPLFFAAGLAGGAALAGMIQPS